MAKPSFSPTVTMNTQMWVYIKGLVQDCSNSSELAMELLQSRTKPLMLYNTFKCHYCNILSDTCTVWPVKPTLTHLLRTYNKHPLTHWGRVTHICVGKLTIIASDNGLSPGRRQAIIWTNAGILLIEPLGTNFSEILIGIQIFSFKKMRLKMSSAKWRRFCLGLNELNILIQRG